MYSNCIKINIHRKAHAACCRLSARKFAPNKEDVLLIQRLPVKYQDLAVAVSKTKDTQLPSHRTSDCAIELIPGVVLTRGRVFPLTQLESEAMRTYTEEELAKVFIRPSTSPASEVFFFMKQKDGGLWPCIDYRHLNNITVKFS